MEQELKKHFAEITARINAASSVIPAQRAAFKQGFSFSKQPFEAQLPIWHHTWKTSKGFRPMIHAFFFLEQYVDKKEHHATIWDTSVSWQEEVDDWGLCDALAKVNTKVLESYPDKVYKTLKAWNKSTDLWKRRQSVVSLLYYSRTKKTFLPVEKIRDLIEPLLIDKEYYVQKGVGWAMRELHNVYPKEAMEFLQRHIKDVSAIAFTIAIEKMTGKEKDTLKLLRKKRGATPDDRLK